MRFNVYAEKEFFADKRYVELERLLAAAGAGCFHDSADLIDVQINPVILALGAGQYVYDSDHDGAMRFSVAERSGVVVEIDHVNQLQDASVEKLLCQLVVVLIASVCPPWRGQNCWSKLHGGATNQTGWCDDNSYAHQVTFFARDVVEKFANNDITATEMVEKLRDPLANNWVERPRLLS